MKIGDYIKKKREENDLLQAQLAEIANVSQTNLSHIEKYNRMPKFDVVCQLCDVLNINVQYLWENIKDEYLKDEYIALNKIPKEGDVRQQIPNSVNYYEDGRNWKKLLELLKCNSLDELFKPVVKGFEKNAEMELFIKRIKDFIIYKKRIND